MSIRSGNGNKTEVWRQNVLFFYSVLTKMNEVEEHFGLLLWQRFAATLSPGWRHRQCRWSPRAPPSGGSAIHQRAAAKMDTSNNSHNLQHSLAALKMKETNSGCRSLIRLTRLQILRCGRCEISKFRSLSQMDQGERCLPSPGKPRPRHELILSAFPHQILHFSVGKVDLNCAGGFAQSSDAGLSLEGFSEAHCEMQTGTLARLKYPVGEGVGGGGPHGKHHGKQSGRVISGYTLAECRGSLCSAWSR